MTLADWPLTEDDARALEARGPAFERLEWLGDSLLDLVGAGALAGGPAVAVVLGEPLVR